MQHACFPGAQNDATARHDAAVRQGPQRQVRPDVCGGIALWSGWEARGFIHRDSIRTFVLICQPRFAIRVSAVLVDAGLLPDDTAAHLPDLRVTLTTVAAASEEGLVVTLESVTAKELSR